MTEDRCKKCRWSEVCFGDYCIHDEKIPAFEDVSILKDFQKEERRYKIRRTFREEDD